MDSPEHVYVLHRIFLPRINNVLEQLTLGWNKHPLRTAQNWSPEQIWVNGMNDQINRSQLQIADLHVDSLLQEDLDWYGCDPDAPAPIENLSHVEVEDIQCPLNNDQLAVLNTVDVLENSDSYGIDIYMQALAVVGLG